MSVRSNNTNAIRYDIEEFNVDSKAEYSIGVNGLVKLNDSETEEFTVLRYVQLCYFTCVRLYCVLARHELYEKKRHLTHIIHRLGTYIITISPSYYSQ